MHTIKTLLTILALGLSVSCGTTKVPMVPLPGRVVTLTDTTANVQQVQRKRVTAEASHAAATASATTVKERTAKVVQTVRVIDNPILKQEVLELETDVALLTDSVRLSETQLADYAREVDAMSAVMKRVEDERNAAVKDREQMLAAAQDRETTYLANEAVKEDAIKRATTSASYWRKRAVATWTLLGGAGIIFVLMKLRPGIRL